MKGTGAVRLVSRDNEATIAAIRGLLQRALEGRCIGLAWVEFMPGKQYHAETVGYAETVDPTWARGCVRILDDEYRERVLNDAYAAPDFEP